MQSVIYSFDYENELDFLCTKKIVINGNRVYFNHGVSLKKMNKRFGNMRNLKVHCIRYDLKISFDFNNIKQIIKQNYIYEPELSLALIWIQPGIKTYFYPNNKCELYIHDITCVDTYITMLKELLYK